MKWLYLTSFVQCTHVFLYYIPCSLIHLYPSFFQNMSKLQHKERHNSHNLTSYIFSASTNAPISSTYLIWNRIAKKFYVRIYNNKYKVILLSVSVCVCGIFVIWFKCFWSIRHKCIFMMYSVSNLYFIIKWYNILCLRKKLGQWITQSILNGAIYLIA